MTALLWTTLSTKSWGQDWDSRTRNSPSFQPEDLSLVSAASRLSFPWNQFSCDQCDGHCFVEGERISYLRQGVGRGRSPGCRDWGWLVIAAEGHFLFSSLFSSSQINFWKIQRKHINFAERIFFNRKQNTQNTTSLIKSPYLTCNLVLQIIQSHKKLHNLEFVGTKGQNQLLIFEDEASTLENFHGSICNQELFLYLFISLLYDPVPKMRGTINL